MKDSDKEIPSPPSGARGLLFTHKEVLNKILANSCKEPFYEPGNMNGKGENKDRWESFHLKVCCVDFIIIARLINPDIINNPDKKIEYEIRTLFWSN